MVGFEFRISTRALEDLVHKALIEGIPAHSMEVNSFDIQLKVLGSPTVHAEDKCISISLPLGIHFARQAGLFTVQGHGKINVHIESNYDVNASFALSTRSAIATHHWIEKPVIDFGSLDITVEKLVDLILKHYHDMIAYGIDKALKTNFDLRNVVYELVEHVKKEIGQFSFHGLKLFIEPSELLIEPVRNEDGKMVFKGALRADIACAKENPLPANELYLRWVETMLNDNITYVHVDVKEETISDILLNL
ncbi:MAG: DUF4403 family protein [Saprospiraceae bacterium]|nr:DUF4403 family protein [Saprospiraceae bacterium]